MKNVFIIGSKGIPAKYGGFETFVENLIKRKNNEEIMYHVSCMAEDNKEFYYKNSRCFNVRVPNVGSARAVLYDLLSIKECIRYIQKHQLKNCIIYILACRIGPFLGRYKGLFRKLGVEVYVNPDGHEWKRSKWNYWIKKYWKFSERLMVKHADLLICDSKGIESYIQTEYKQYKPSTTYISYGAEVERSLLHETNQVVNDWFNKFKIKPNQYYLIVGRFVPENNYEFMIKEFMNSKTKKSLVIITNVENNKFYNRLLKITSFDKDPRIMFVGTVYDQLTLKKIREQAFGYLHGHEVGGTNPSLLEALASTNLNLLLDVIFNREVGGGSAVYFKKEKGNLTRLIDNLDQTNLDNIVDLGNSAKKRIVENYSWENIIDKYEMLFLNKFF